MLTADRLREVLSYDPDTGVFTWTVRRSNILAGSEAGTLVHGRTAIRVDGRRYLAYRLAWLYVYGTWPTKDLDHIDENPSNNRIANLREATNTQNHQNHQNISTPMATNRSGFRGVMFDASRNKWKAQIKADGSNHYLGRFNTPEEASEAYLAAKAVLHPFWAEAQA